MKLTPVFATILINSSLFAAAIPLVDSFDSGTINKSFRTVKGDIVHIGSENKSIVEWHHKYPSAVNSSTSMEGIGTELVYAQYGKQINKGKEIIVAVVDSGCDINHADLKANVWTNKGEIPGNGIDDDGNGYIDDVHGWNFIGGKNGKNVTDANLEQTRLYRRYSKIQNPTQEEQRLLAIYKKSVKECADSYGQAHPYCNPNFDIRAEMVGDDPSDFTDLNYGNNQVFIDADDAVHSTHVAGTIGAVRNNGKDSNGVAQNVKIMPVRVVPNGDERDKDVYAGIKYAVDNGASIVNMSFGKSFSPYKSKIDEIVKYANDRGVLLIVSAGNSAYDLDVKTSYPTNTMDDGTVAENFIFIGASAKSRGRLLPAYFSNFGANSVDLFSPGHYIQSLRSGGGTRALSGTSMASPVVSGSLALVKSVSPELSAMQLKDILLNNVRVVDVVVKTPCETSSCPADTNFQNLSITGGIVDLVKMFDALDLSTPAEEVKEIVEEEPKVVVTEVKPVSSDQKMGFFRRLLSVFRR